MAIAETASAEKHDDKKKTITIVINGTPKTIPKVEKISFETVVELAFDPVPTGPNVMISVDYENGPKQNVEGILRPGRPVHIQEGMIFDATATDKS